MVFTDEETEALRAAAIHLESRATGERGPVSGQGLCMMAPALPPHQQMGEAEREG